MVRMLCIYVVIAEAESNGLKATLVPRMSPYSLSCLLSELPHRGRDTLPSPFLLPPPRETSGHQRKCAAWSSQASAPSAPRLRTKPRRSPDPMSAASSGLLCLNWLRCGRSPSRFWWGSPSAALCHKTSSATFPVPPRNLSVVPVGKEAKCIPG